MTSHSQVDSSTSVPIIAPDDTSTPAIPASDPSPAPEMSSTPSAEPSQTDVSSVTQLQNQPHAQILPSAAQSDQQAPNNLEVNAEPHSTTSDAGNNPETSSDDIALTGETPLVGNLRATSAMPTTSDGGNNPEASSNYIVRADDTPLAGNSQITSAMPDEIPSEATVSNATASDVNVGNNPTTGVLNETERNDSALTHVPNLQQTNASEKGNDQVEPRSVQHTERPVDNCLNHLAGTTVSNKKPDEHDEMSSKGATDNKQMEDINIAPSIAEQKPSPSCESIPETAPQSASAPMESVAKPLGTGNLNETSDVSDELSTSDSTQAKLSSKYVFAFVIHTCTTLPT